jgi:tetratricopeptide (TPR) repeat protein
MQSREIQVNPKVLAVCLVLLAAVIVVFGQTIRHEFINFDDPSYVFENPQVSKGLTPSSVVWAFSKSYHSIWIPLTWISLMIDWEFYDVHAGGYHLTNLVLHAVTAMLLFLWLYRMTNRYWSSAIVAALFAVHPLRVESVAWVTERKDVLSGAFFMAALLAYSYYAKNRFSLIRYGLVCVLFVLGLMAKPMIVTLPCVLLLLDYWPLQRFGVADPEKSKDLRTRDIAKNIGRLVLEKIPLFAIAAADAVVTYCVQESHALTSNENLSFLQRAGYAAVAYVTYLGHFFWPWGLLPVYPRHEMEVSSWRICISLFVLLCITIVVFLRRRRHPYALVGWLWYLGMFVPVVGFLQVGLTAIANRFTYLPSVGLCMALTWEIADWCGQQQLRQRAWAVATAVVLLALTAIATYQTYFWRDDETLWKYTLELSPKNCVALTNYGDYLASQGKEAEAKKQFELALDAWANSSITHYNIGCMALYAGDFKTAEKYFCRALEFNPKYEAALDQLGDVFFQQGKYDIAIAFYSELLKIDPNNAGAYYRTSKCLRAMGRIAQADEAAFKGAEIAPGYGETHYQLGLLAASRHNVSSAIDHFQRAVDANPTFAEARNHFAKALAEKNRWRDAASQYKAVLEFDENNAEAKKSLEALRASGRVK